MSEQSTAAPERWAIIEIMGHRVIAGRLAWGEVPFDKGVAVDVPLPPAPGELNAPPRFLQEFYGAGAIFGVRLVPEQLARQEAEQSWHVRGMAKALLPAPAKEEKRPSFEDLHAREAVREELYRELDDLLDGRDEGEDGTMPAEGWLKAIEARLEDLRAAPPEEPGEQRDAQLALAETVLAAILSLDAQAEDETAAGAGEVEDPDEDAEPCDRCGQRADDHDADRCRSLGGVDQAENDLPL